jgi:TonB family protein
MSYRALLFCPDEAAARLVTQVLSELDFTVELSFEPFVTVKKLTDEPFDAVVVDCGNEQNASLLFKGARNSSLNHSSLCVAVVEGQMGVAKAFRIGANLVLTKPINIEQSKGTLRVARGLLRKTEPISTPRATSDSGGTTSQSFVPVPSSLIAAQPSPAAPSSVVAAASSEQPTSTRAAAVPSSLFEAEQDKPATHNPDDLKPRESMPDFLISKPATVESSLPVAPKSASDRFAGGIPTSAAAAPALAPERPKVAPIDQPVIRPAETNAVRQIQTAAPLATQETIIPQARFPEPSLAPVPTFSSYARRPSPGSGIGNKIIWTLICLLILAPAGYFGWLKLQPMRYIHRPVSAIGTETTSGSKPAVPDTAPVNTAPAEQQNDAPSVSSPDSLHESPTPNSTYTAPEGFPTKENIDVGQPLEVSDSDITVVSKPQPLQVNKKPAEAVQAPPTPPSLVLPESKAADALAGIVSSQVAVPKPAPGALQVSEGVSQGLLIRKIAPAYPPAARQLRKQGGVELLATVGKTGDITQVKVLSGDSILAKAAVDAVRQWKYRPFLLSAEPVQIETRITINFRLPN